MSRSEKFRRRGRIIGLAVFGVVVTALTVMWAVQIIGQIFVSEPATSTVQCRPGIRNLIEAVHRARQAAASQTGGERAALGRFRSELNPAWSARDQLTTACRGDVQAQGALREVDLLRYAEEHAVRYDVQELARLRRRVDALQSSLFLHPGDAPPPVPTERGLELVPEAH